MFATLIALIFSSIILFNWGLYFDPLPTDVISYTEGFYGLGFLLSLILALSWKKIRITPLVAFLFAYPFFTFAIAVFMASRVIPNALYLVPIWLIVTGLATDGFYWLMKNSSKPTLNDIQKLITNAKNVTEYQEGIDLLGQETAQSIDNNAFHQTNQSLNLFSTIFSKVRQGEGKEVQILYPFEMLEMLALSAIDKNQTLVAQKIFTTLGTLALECFKIDPNLASFALNKIENATLVALSKKQYELAIKGAITIQQTILLSPENKGWGSFFAQGIRSLDHITKETFKLDKNQSIPNLLVPFVEIDNVLKNYEQSAEYPIAKTELTRVIEEYRALESVLRTLPKIEEPNP